VPTRDTDRVRLPASGGNRTELPADKQERLEVRSGGQGEACPERIIHGTPVYTGANINQASQPVQAPKAIRVP